MSQDPKMQSLSQEIVSFLHHRVFRNSHFKSLEEYQHVYDSALKDPELFWGSKAKEHLRWDQSFNKVLEWNASFSEMVFGWKAGTPQLQCSDKFKGTSTWGKKALIWEGENGEIRNFTYEQLAILTQKTTNALKTLLVSEKMILS